MKKSSGLSLFFFLFAVSFLLFPDLLGAETDIKIPDIIGNVNNPYILPESGEPGFWLSAAIGLAAGMLSSSIGAGGGLIVVPALMSAGIAGVYAIGSEIFRLFIFSTIQSIRMGINKRINYLMALYLMIGTTLGGLGGYKLSKAVFLADPAGSDVFISSMIILWLLVYSFIIVPEFRESSHEYALEMLRKEKGEQEDNSAVQIDQPKQETESEKSEDGENTDAGNKEEGGIKNETKPEIEDPGQINNQTTGKAELEDDLYPDEEPWPIARTMRTIKFPPYIKFPGTIKDKQEEDTLEPAIMRRGAMDDLKENEQEERPDYDRIPVIPAVLLSTVGGFFMALTGSGGVILSFTILTKAFGCVAALVAGTDLGRLAISSGVLSMGTYGLDGLINIYCITGLVFGTMTGLHLGSKALLHILPYRVKGLISLLVISVILNRILALPALLIKSGASIPHGLASTLAQSGDWIMLIGTTTFCGWLIYSFGLGFLESLTPPEERTDQQEAKK